MHQMAAPPSGAGCWSSSRWRCSRRWSSTRW